MPKYGNELETWSALLLIWNSVGMVPAMGVQVFSELNAEVIKVFEL